MRRFLFALAVLVATGFAPARAEKGIQFEAEKIVGKIQKPEIQILITKQNLTPKYELTLRESFLPSVVESVERKPF